MFLELRAHTQSLMWLDVIVSSEPDIDHKLSLFGGVEPFAPMNSRLSLPLMRLSLPFYQGDAGQIWIDRAAAMNSKP
nr:hypothetical protein [uncultured Tateyamaria sp.]